MSKQPTDVSIPGLIPFHAPAAVIDIETTGFYARKGDRIVDIALVVITGPMAGKTWQSFVNPQRDVPEGAAQIHGLRNDFLIDKPIFEEVAPKFLDFVKSLSEEAYLIAHNGKGFDFPFINHELQRVGQPMLNHKTCADSLSLARYLFPYQGNSLDALCRRFNLDLSAREKHGALLDCQLLAQVYLSMARSSKIPLPKSFKPAALGSTPRTSERGAFLRPASEEEKRRHETLLKTMTNPPPLWDKS